MSALTPRPYAVVRSELQRLRDATHAFLSSSGWSSLAAELHLLARYCEARASELLVLETEQRAPWWTAETPALSAAADAAQREPPHERLVDDREPLLSPERDTRTG